MFAPASATNPLAPYLPPLAGEENIREVIAYPKTQSGADLLTGRAPPLPAASLAELGIRVVVPPGSAGSGTSPDTTPS